MPIIYVVVVFCCLKTLNVIKETKISKSSIPLLRMNVFVFSETISITRLISFVSEVIEEYILR